DDPAVRRSMQLLFQGNGFDVRAFVSAEALLSSPVADSSDCLVIDFRLDGADGIELLSALRGRGWAEPAILITGYSTPDVVHRAAENDFVMVFEKPLRERSLLETVRRLAQPHA